MTPLEQAIADLTKVKTEHQGILEVIQNDPGMHPDTRTTLTEHLYEEEDEHLAEIATLGGDASALSLSLGVGSDGRTQAGSGAGSGPKPPSVGSLRPQGPARLRVGNLRPDAPNLPGSSVGSLRS